MGTIGKKMSYEDISEVDRNFRLAVETFTGIPPVFEYIGSYARSGFSKDLTYGDLDLVVANLTGELPGFLTDQEFLNLGHCTVERAGKRTMTLLTEEGFQIDISSCSLQEKGCSMLHWMGDKDFNIKLRSWAKSKGLSLNQYCITVLGTDDKLYFTSPDAVLEYLGLRFIPYSRRNKYCRLKDYAT